MTGATVVRAFADAGAGDRASVGGKGASLGELARAGLPVPPGFVVTAVTFTRAMAALDPDGAIRREIGRLPAGDSARIAEAAARARRSVSAAPLPPGVRAEILAAYERIRGSGEVGPPVAVRSSGTSEDGHDASFAGLQDTYLCVRGGDAVADHVRKCWASLYNAEAVSYRRQQGIAEDGIAMAVVVQRMVDPLSAGVMFTCSPATGDRSVVAVEGSWGLGSALVSGDVTPDSYLVSKVTGDIVRRAVSVKLRWHRVDPAAGGVADEPVPADLRERPCLTDEEVHALAELARRVEAHYGSAQDIEWAILPPDAVPGPGDVPPHERVVVLQSRPETVWASRRAEPVAAPRARAFDHVFAHLGAGATGKR